MSLYRDFGGIEAAVAYYKKSEFKYFFPKFGCPVSALCLYD